ncbi:hypothetical protein Tco_0272625 [Tanacetum coccineum]
MDVYHVGFGCCGLEHHHRQCGNIYIAFIHVELRCHKLKKTSMMHESIEEDEVSLVDGVLEGALGALGDDSRSLGDGVIVSYFVKSMKSCFGSMMVNFGFFDGLEMEAFGEAMEVDNG